MELLIALHSAEKIFIGDAPKDVEGYLKHFLLSMGYSATAFATNRRRGAPIASARGPRGLSELCAAGALFKRRYCHNNQNVSWTLDSIKPIIEAKREEDSEDSEDEGSKQKKSTKSKTAVSGVLFSKPTKRNSQSISTTDFLEDLANALNAESPELSVDYLRMHRFCWMLLRKVNEVCKPQLVEMGGAGYLEKENQLPFVVGYIFMAATQTGRVANVLLPKRDNFQVSSRLLAKAAEQIKTMIETGAGEIESRFLAMRLGAEEIDFSQLDDVDNA